MSVTIPTADCSRRQSYSENCLLVTANTSSFFIIKNAKTLLGETVNVKFGVGILNLSAGMYIYHPSYLSKN